MNLEKLKKKRISSLQNAYDQLIGALNEKLDPKEVDPEKRKSAMALYKQAAEDSDYILKQIIDLMEEEGEIVKVEKKKTTSGKFSPEDRIKR